MAALRRWRSPAAAAVCCLALGACSSSSSGGPGVSEPTLKLKVGQCLNPPTTVKAELANVKVVYCRTSHTQEVYALATYNLGPTDATATFPGAAMLKTFADGACAQRFQNYVGDAYPDSSLFFTYLLPSPRSWQSAGDRTVECIVSTTGQQLKQSVRNSKL